MYGYFEMKFALGAAAAITGASALIYLLLRPRKRRLDPGKRKPTTPYAAAPPSYEEHGKVSRRGNAEVPVKSGDDVALHNLNGHVSGEKASTSSESPNASVRKVEDEKLRGSGGGGVEKDFSLDDDVNDIQRQRCPLVEKDFSLDDEFHGRPEQSDELPHVASSPVLDVSAKPDAVVTNDSSHLLKELSDVTADIVEDRTVIPNLEDITATSLSAVDPEISKTCQVEVCQERRLDFESLDKPECDQVDGNIAVGLEAARLLESTAPLKGSAPEEANESIPSIPEQVTSLSSDVQCGEPLSNRGESFEERETAHSSDPAKTSITNMDGNLATADCDSGIYVSCDNQNSSSRLLEESKLDKELEPVTVGDVKEVNESVITPDNVSLVDKEQNSFESVESAACQLSHEGDTLTGQPEVQVSQSGIENSSVPEEKSVSLLSAESGESNLLSQGCEVVLETCKVGSAPEFSSEVTVNSSDACEKDLSGLSLSGTVASSTFATTTEESAAKDGLVEDCVQVTEKRTAAEHKAEVQEIAEKEICVGSTVAASELSPGKLKENQEDKSEVVMTGKVSESPDVDAKKQSKPGVSADATNLDQNKSPLKTAAPKKEEAKKAKGTESKSPSAKTTKESSPSSESGSGGRRSYKGRTRNPVGGSPSSANEEPLVPKENEDQAKDEPCSVEDPAATKEKSTADSSWRAANTKPNKDHASIQTKGEAAVGSAKESNKTVKDSNKAPKTKKEAVDCSKNKSYKERVRNTQGSEHRKSESEDRTLDNNDRNLRSNESSQSSIGEVEPETLFNPSAFPVTSQETYIFYEFEIPQVLVGRLIGRKGAFVNKIKAATDASIIVGPHRNRRFKMCSVEGTKSQVEAALDMIREYFPINRYPELTLAQVHSRSPALPPVHGVINNQAMQIELAMGVVVEVRVSAVASGNEIWVQQPLHPSFSALQRLQACMNLNYGDGSTTPQIPGPIPERTVCVAQIDTQWYRCQVLSATEETVLVVLLDVGGALTVPASSLRQIRRDYATLPFQATQCLLHGIQPTSGKSIDDDVCVSNMYY
ncbi:KH domain-containing protein akap-1-like [Macrobrachium nipponense]|uniref:KH domain-containing protein akap-1-like n=1 Tax=Macrobrachium nipponense TaxID=159736 RepID=UPI0030C840BE